MLLIGFLKDNKTLIIANTKSENIAISLDSR
jgi:hypothetical protein